MQIIQEADFWNPNFSQHIWLWLFAAISYVPSYHSCWKMWICRLGIIYGSHMLVVHTFSSCSSGILEQPVPEAVDSTKWTNRTACSFPWLKSLNSFISVDICSLLFVLQKSVTSRTCKNKHWTDLRRSVRNLEISSETASEFSDVRLAICSSRWTLRACVSCIAVYIHCLEVWTCISFSQYSVKNYDYLRISCTLYRRQRSWNGLGYIPRCTLQVDWRKPQHKVKC